MRMHMQRVLLIFIFSKHCSACFCTRSAACRSQKHALHLKRGDFCI